MLLLDTGRRFLLRYESPEMARVAVVPSPELGQVEPGRVAMVVPRAAYVFSDLLKTTDIVPRLRLPGQEARALLFSRNRLRRL